MASAAAQKYFKDYASFHKTPGNKICHYFGLPSIMMTLLGLLGAIPIAGGLTGNEFFRLDGGTVLLVLGGIWYLRLDWKLALPYLMVGVGMYFIGRAIPVPALWAIFITGWVVQFIGHGVYEKKRPAFLKNFEHLLIGPFWMFAKIVGQAK
jgi:uncharacterized membrane protein YGL010W